MGFEKAGDRVLHLSVETATEENYQSARTYPPFFLAMNSQEIWLDPATAVLRIDSLSSVYPMSGARTKGSTNIDDGKNAEFVQGDQRRAISRRMVSSRGLNAWAVIADWSAATDVELGGSETFRDYPRLVLTRHTGIGDERLLIDGKSGFPVKLDYVEPHYLWGQRHIEYVWSEWVSKDGLALPGSAFRIADGDVEISQTVSTAELVARTAAPSLTPPQPPQKAPADLPLFLQPIAPQTTRIGPDTWLLSNPGYNEVAALIGEEIYIFDSTQGETRAREDAEQIAKLFPGARKVNLVITDLAWPHIAGVRYWVAQGATIMAHPAARAFLEHVVDRQWTQSPDELEQSRSRGKRIPMKFVPVDGFLRLAQDRVELMPIDGIGSEVALMAYLPADKFLWASDYIQTLDEPSLYAAEVIRAAERAGIVPDRFAAEHVPLNSWQQVQTAQQVKSPESRSN